MIKHSKLTPNHMPNKYLSELKQLFLKIDSEDDYSNFLLLFKKNLKKIIGGSINLKPQLIFQLLKDKRIDLNILKQNKDYIFEQIALFIFSSKLEDFDIIKIGTALGIAEDNMTQVVATIMELDPDELIQMRINYVKNEFIEPCEAKEHEYQNNYNRQEHYEAINMPIDITEVDLYRGIHKGKKANKIKNQYKQTES